ncbi:hypothetical protein DL95DRAFT_383998 [Leptodontidium sp. 2 PMI_412]|nr:hypothetical protein DL95DRAFT_383998 [Leptodontidium sp. 2 PMI_412]
MYTSFEGRRVVRSVVWWLLSPTFTLHKILDGRGFEIYQELVAQYSQKELSFPEDILNGFSGIINALKPFGNVGQYWISGLPVGGNRLVILSMLCFGYRHTSTRTN